MYASFNKPELEANQILMDKQALADRYQVGVHTIERWQAAGIIDGERRGLRNYYHLEASEHRLWNHGKTKAVMKKSEQIPIDAKYVGKRALAARYSVSLHTIDKWMIVVITRGVDLLQRKEMLEIMFDDHTQNPLVLAIALGQADFVLKTKPEGNPFHIYLEGCFCAGTLTCYYRRAKKLPDLKPWKI